MELLKAMIMNKYNMSAKEWDEFIKRENNINEWYELMILKLKEEQANV